MNGLKERAAIEASVGVGKRVSGGIKADILPAIIPRHTL